MISTIYKYVILIIVILLSISSIGNGIINTSKYNGYALIGSNPNSKMAFATLLAKKNKTLPFSFTNKYEVSQIFNEPSKSFGSSTALGRALFGGSNITIGAIGDESQNGSIYVYNIDECVESNSNNTTKCDYLFIQESVDEKDDFECTIGSQTSIGPNFIVSSCNNNLLSSKKKSSPISVCILDLDKNSNNCSNVLYLEKPVWKPCIGGKGQMYTTALDVYENKIVIGLCGICMSPNKSQIQIEYNSAFVLIEVINGTLVTDYKAQTTLRTESCPSTMTFNDDWVIIGYSEEELVDMYYKNYMPGGSSSGSSSSSSGSNNNSNGDDDDESSLLNHVTTNKKINKFGDLANATEYRLFDSISEFKATGYGVDISISKSMLIVSSTGDPTLNITGNVFFYDIFTDNSSYPVRTGSKAMVPNLNYITTFDYQYGISYFGTEILVISQDPTLKKMGFNFYSVCPAGAEWSSIYYKCLICDAGQYKTVSSIHIDNSSFELCGLCPGGYYTTDKVFGLSSISECSNFGNNKCGLGEFCPDGSVYPLIDIPVETNSQAFPDLDESEELDFESTFYNSCYPYFLIIMGGMIVLTLCLCLPWPRNHQTKQRKVIDLLLKINFYDWDGDSMTEEIEYLEQTSNDRISISSSRDSMKRRVFVRKRRTAVKPVKAVEAFCTYYFLVVLVLMIIFIIQFQRINSDISTELRSLGQASTQLTPGQIYSDAQYLKFVDSSSIIITLDLYGFNGVCSKDELKLTINGCQNKNYMGNCKVETQFEIIDYIPTNSTDLTPLSNQSCRITSNIDYGAVYSDTTDFYFDITPEDTYFYTQRIIYNISTNNNQSSINTGNSYVSGVIQPLEGTILRQGATVSILSMMTMISDCKIKSNNNGLSLIRPMIERCLYDSQSYKEFSFNSNSTTYLMASEYHSVSPTFQFNIHLEKSVFYHYVMNSHSTSFGQIITVILFAILDVFWVIEVFVPAIQTLVGSIEEHIKKKRQIESGECYETFSNELEGLIKNQSKTDHLISKMKYGGGGIS